MKINTNESHAATPTEQVSWERSMLEKLLLEVYREQRRSRIWRWVGRLLWLLLIAMVLFTLTSGKRELGAAKAHTAVINLSGTIDSDQNQADMLRDALETAYGNPNVKGIIIRANSPGGSPVISNIAFEEIRRLKALHRTIPLYVVAEDMCASGCYYIASAADKIYADPSSLVGSIGVIGSSFDFTGLMDKLGVKRRIKIAGSNKDMGDPFTPETAAQTQIWQDMLQDIHQKFIASVKQGRGNRLHDGDHPDVFSGRVYTGTEAKKVGLIDDFGNVYSVSRDVIKAPELVDYTPDEGISKRLSRRLGSEVQQGLQGLAEKPW
ncbi:S49 family peptidase [Snodgrassella sp. CFCC 13594]|uniref:S49 family peptidase n=1 Tax=Snodgrassella sp. CFCC 13594 TaxID=1775559 RepID=UPI00082E7C99|nr:S49 family peptidase [Snodgrassella sp. CFCC 13594]